MFIRLALAVCILSFVAGCFSGMKVSVEPPECTSNENNPECSTVPTAPQPMSEEDFFQDETSLMMHYWDATA